MCPLPPLSKEIVQESGEKIAHIPFQTHRILSHRWPSWSLQHRKALESSSLYGSCSCTCSLGLMVPEHTQVGKFSRTWTGSCVK